MTPFIIITLACTGAAFGIGIAVAVLAPVIITDTEE